MAGCCLAIVRNCVRCWKEEGEEVEKMSPLLRHRQWTKKRGRFSIRATETVEFYSVSLLSGQPIFSYGRSVIKFQSHAPWQYACAGNLRCGRGVCICEFQS